MSSDVGWTRLQVVQRHEWLAMETVHVIPPKFPVRGVFCGLQTWCDPCDNTWDCGTSVREMQFEQITLEKQDDIRWNFLIGGDGNIYEGRGWRSAPLLPRRYQQFTRSALYIAFIGDLRDETYITEEMIKKRNAIIVYGLMNKLIAERFLFFNMHDNLIMDDDGDDIYL